MGTIFEKTSNNTNLGQYKNDILKLVFVQAEAALQQGEYWRASDLHCDMNRYISSLPPSSPHLHLSPLLSSSQVFLPSFDTYITLFLTCPPGFIELLSLAWCVLSITETSNIAKMSTQDTQPSSLPVSKPEIDAKTTPN